MRIIITGETSDLLNQSIKLLSKAPGIDIVICNGETELEATNAELVKSLEDALKILEGIYESPNVEGAALFVGGNDIVDIQEALASARGES